MPSRIIEPAVRKNIRARIAIDGPTGSGKTWSALGIGTELAQGGKLMLIDTERGSAKLYADSFAFDVVEWGPPYDPTELASFLCKETEGYAVVVVDSLSHFWMGEGGTLDVVDTAKARVKNGFAAWKTGTEAQNYLVEQLLTCGAHVICTMRSKMAYLEQEDERGKTTIQKVGLAPVQREGLEYEFTVVADMDLQHRMSISKSRCPLVADRTFPAHREREFGAILRDWLAGGAVDPVETVTARLRQMTDDDRAAFKALLGITELSPRALRENPGLTARAIDALKAWTTAPTDESAPAGTLDAASSAEDASQKRVATRPEEDTLDQALPAAPETEAPQGAEPAAAGLPLAAQPAPPAGAAGPDLAARRADLLAAVAAMDAKAAAQFWERAGIGVQATAALRDEKRTTNARVAHLLDLARQIAGQPELSGIGA